MPGRWCPIFRGSPRALLAGALAIVGVGAWLAMRSPLAERAAAAFARGGQWAALKIEHPLDGAVFPPDLAPPTITWKPGSPDGDAWVVRIESSTGAELLLASCGERKYRPRRDLWEKVKGVGPDTPVRVRVLEIGRSAPERILAAGSVALRFAREPVDAPVFYRDVPLPFQYAVCNPSTIRWRLGDLSEETPAPVVLEDLPVCGNCHSFSKDGKVLGLDVDYGNDKGSYAMVPVFAETAIDRNHIFSWAQYRPEDKMTTLGLLSQVSPDGRHVVSTVKDRSVFVPRDDLTYSQLFFPIKGILVDYHPATKVFTPIRGADDPALVQSNPTFSPDGKTIYFARAKAVRMSVEDEQKGVFMPMELVPEFLTGKRGFQFDIYRVPYNGGKGGRAEPVKGASHNGMSNYFPRVSPDGRWLVFNQARNFMLLQPDSTLYIMPTAGGAPRKMTCNLPSMNSWHSWSPNGRWLVFSSKLRGPYTDLWLTHIDENGQDAPPVLLERLSVEGRAANIPEFVNARPGSLKRIVHRFLDDANFVHQGLVVELMADWESAARAYEKALSIKAGDVAARLSLARAYLALGRLADAERELKVVLGQQPSALEARVTLAFLKMKGQRYHEVVRDLSDVLSRSPENPEARLYLALAYSKIGEFERSEKEFREAVRLHPDNAGIRANLALALMEMGRAAEAISEGKTALRDLPRQPKNQFQTAVALFRIPELRDDLAGFLEKVVELQPALGQAHLMLADIYLRRQDLDLAIRSMEAARKAPNPPPWLEAKIGELRAQRRDGR